MGVATVPQTNDLAGLSDLIFKALARPQTTTTEEGSAGGNVNPLAALLAQLNPDLVAQQAQQGVNYQTDRLLQQNFAPYLSAVNASGGYNTGNQFLAQLLSDTAGQGAALSTQARLQAGQTSEAAARDLAANTKNTANRSVAATKPGIDFGTLGASVLAGMALKKAGTSIWDKAGSLFEPKPLDTSWAEDRGDLGGSADFADFSPSGGSVSLDSGGAGGAGVAGGSANGIVADPLAEATGFTGLSPESSSDAINSATLGASLGSQAGIAPYSTVPMTTGGLAEADVGRPATSMFQQQAGESPIYGPDGEIVGWKTAGAETGEEGVGALSGGGLESDALTSSSDVAASEGATDAGAFDAAAGAGEASTDLATTAGLGDILPPIAAIDFLSDGGITQSIGEAGQFFGDAASNAWDIVSNPVAAVGRASIICTELNRQGKLSRRLYVPSARIFAQYDERGKQGYYIWATPVVNYIRKNPNSRITSFVAKIFTIRNEYLAAKAGIKNIKKTFGGYLIDRSMYAFCWTLSRIMPYHG